MCPGNFRSTVVSLLTGLLFASMGEVVLAQSVSSEHLEEIVVTATRRPVSLEDVPVAITAITGADLRMRASHGLRILRRRFRIPLSTQAADFAQPT